MEEENAHISNGSNLPRKVVAVAAGEAHTLALAGDGFVYGWGRGMFGRLGTGSEADELSPVRIKFDDPRGEQGTRVKFVGVATGAYHSLALADDGTVWCWGYNIYGQLGVNGENLLVPCLLERFLEMGSESESEVPLKVSSIKAGGMMSLAIDCLGALWIWGHCPLESSSNEGGFSLVSTFTPTPVWDFHGHTVVKVACGNEHVVALVSAGETYKGEDLVCFSWGGNNHGQLGLGDKESRNRPEIVEAFNRDSSFAVYELACGAFHTALLTHIKRPNDTLESMCWTFGLGDNGQLGHGTTQSALYPEPVMELPPYVYLVSVDCGLFHTSVVSSAGDVWSWGMEKGLGLCPDASFTGTYAGDAVSPLQINGFNGPKFQDPVQVVCGAAHTVLVANDGYKLWSWGRGRSGVLGNGKMIDCYAPTAVLWPPLAEDFKQEELNTVDKKDTNNDADKIGGKITTGTRDKIGEKNSTGTRDKVGEKNSTRTRDKTGEKNSTGTRDKIGEKNLTGATEAEERLSLAMEEVKLVQSKLSVMEKYAGILHGSIFGKPLEEQDIPISLQNSGTYDIAREWESMLDSADSAKLIRLEKFYRNMLAGVKDKQMKIRIQGMISECLNSSAIKRGDGDVKF